MVSKLPEERVLIARLAAYTKWSRSTDRVADTARGRQAARDRFEKQVDPEGVLDPQERAIRAESARKAFYTKMALKSAQARRARARAAELEAEVAEGLSDVDGASA